MLTTLLALLLSAQTETTSPETSADLARAERDVAIAHEVQASCWTPRECVVARALVTAAEDALGAARALAGAALVVGSEPDPFAPEAEAYASPFADDWPPFAGTPFPTEEDVAAMIAEGEAVAGESM